MKKTLPILALFLFPFASEALGWGEPHRLIARVAVHVLPQWQRDVIKDEIKEYTGTYCLYPDSPLNDPVTKPYLMPGAGMRLHIPRSQPENQEILDYYLPLVNAAFEQGKIQEAMGQFGSLTHYLEDSCCPGHLRYGDSAVPQDSAYLHLLEFFKQYMEVPPEKAGVSLHSVLDGAYEGCFSYVQLQKAMEGYKPRLLGATVKEALFHLGQRHEDMHFRSAKQLIPLLQAYFKDDKKAYAEHSLAAAKGGAELVADLLYTMICISQHKVDPAEAGALPKTVNLADLTIAKGMPFSWRTNYGDQALRNASGCTGLISKYPGNLKPQPLRLLAEGGKVQEFAKGYGVTVGTQYMFLLQPGVFKTFSVTVGNQHELGAEGFAGFQILLDGKVVADSALMDGKATAKVLKIELGQARQLTIRTYGKDGVKSMLCHGVWAEPVLSK